MTPLDMAKGLTRIGTATSHEVSELEFEFYGEALIAQTDAAEWEGFTRAAVASGRWRWWPTVAEVLDALREYRGDQPLAAEATVAYERVVEAGTYCPEGGTRWEARRIREQCGEAALEAFLAAGGHAAFSTGWDESERRKAFLRAYQAAVRAEPSMRLLPAGSLPKLLPAPADYQPPTVDRTSAREVLAKLDAMAPAKPVLVPRGMTASEWEARMAELRRQAEALKADVEVPEGA